MGSCLRRFGGGAGHGGAGGGDREEEGEGEVVVGHLSTDRSMK
ncbi:hypothetical protein BMF35_a0384 [Aurantiacibacter gangjinensis]|nr:hypothetical protein BMF35_a0384 [Aurantiacibacter gangjinensis]